MDSFAGFCQEKYDVDLRAAKWFAQELIDASYNGPMKGYLFKMESEYRAAFRTIIGYVDEEGNYIKGYLDKDVPFWWSVEEVLVNCMKDFTEMSERHPNSTLYPAIVDAADTILDYLGAGLPE